MSSPADYIRVKCGKCQGTITIDKPSSQQSADEILKGWHSDHVPCNGLNVLMLDLSDLDLDL